ncbi:diguanylate cyclase [Paenibacillus sp. JNUCC32]|uniref:diguanylate cyclase n=1 Tax=Paenibacillus sp. JNUCC32 TaxID=2777984 RepID=UPI00178870EE|nr:diguanylate cyclase [Paenibacillus sp. JNUCC-32]QOT09709.1 diguanylate cyclase [Paenibacillus sp. JNUCC-32]
MTNILFTNFCIFVTFLYLSGLLSQKYVAGVVVPSFTVKINAGLLFGIYGIILMYYSFPIDPRFFADLRHLAIMVIATYLGWLPSLIAGMLIALGRLILFGMSASSAIAGAGMLLISVVCGILSRTHWNRLSKMLLMSLSSMLVILFIMWMNIPNHQKVFTVFTQQLVISVLATVVIYMLTEYINTSNKLFLQMKKNAETDYLTSLHNLRQFEQLLSERFLEAQHFSERLGVLVVDIDHFKQINDTYGHAAGDVVLQQLSKVLRDYSRSFDEVSRNGGEEFSVLVPEATIDETAAIAERIRAAVEDHVFTLEDGAKIRITVSIGAAVHPDTIRSKNAKELLQQADRELYRAKESGRNRVCSAPEINDLILS